MRPRWRGRRCGADWQRARWRAAPGSGRRTPAGSRGELGQTSTAGLLDGSLHLPQQVFQLLGPGLLVLFLEEGQFAYVMDLAEGMAAAGVPVVRLPAVMHAHPREVRQDAYGVGRLGAALGVDGVVRQPARAGPTPTCAQASRPPRRTPVSSLCSTGTWRSAALSRASTWVQHDRALLDPGDQRPQRQRRPEQVGEQLAHPSIGHELLLDQIHREGAQAWPILGPARRLRREGAHTHRLTVRTAHMQRSRLLDHQA